MNFDEFIEECANKEGILHELSCGTSLSCAVVYPFAEYLVNIFLHGGDAQPFGEMTIHNAEFLNGQEKNISQKNERNGNTFVS